MLSQYGVVLELLSQVESILFLLSGAGTLLTRVKGYAGILISSKWNFIHNTNYQLLQFMIMN